MKETFIEKNEQFVSNFPEVPFLVEHKLQDEKLLRMQHILELCRELPADSIEYNAGDLPVSQDPQATPANGLSIEDTLMRIETCRSWLVLKNVQQSSLYKALLDMCVDKVAEYTDMATTDLRGRQAFIFVSSPGSVTPMHIDPEHNFLLQIRGSKTIHIWDMHDRSVMSEEQLEDFHNGAHRNLPYEEAFERSAKVYTLEPGKGLHFPVTAPHWVQNGPEVSVSFSITFRSSESERLARLYRMNSVLRKRGMSPAPIGTSPGLEAAKDFSFRLIRKSASLMGRASHQAQLE